MCFVWHQSTRRPLTCTETHMVRKRDSRGCEPSMDHPTSTNKRFNYCCSPLSRRLDPSAERCNPTVPQSPSLRGNLSTTSASTRRRWSGCLGWKPFHLSSENSDATLSTYCMSDPRNISLKHWESQTSTAMKCMQFLNHHPAFARHCAIPTRVKICAGRSLLPQPLSLCTVVCQYLRCRPEVCCSCAGFSFSNLCADAQVFFYRMYMRHASQTNPPTRPFSHTQPPHTRSMNACLSLVFLKTRPEAGVLRADHPHRGQRALHLSAQPPRRGGQTRPHDRYAITHT